ncbi:MAG: proline dehydrogenase family protein [Candidatus Limnocylindrales bacterium]
MRRILLWAARNRWLKEHLARYRWVRRATRRFMPGETAADALAAAETHKAWGIDAAFTLLGENLTDLSEARTVVDAYHDLLDESAQRGLKAEISVKLTQLGLDLDAVAAYANFDDLATHAAEKGAWAWIDMEGSGYTERTVAFYERARPAHDNVGLCLQAYLRRTPADLERLLPLKPGIRMVKGAYAEPATIALRSHAEIDGAFYDLSVRLLQRVHDGTARFMAGTHDVALIERIAAAGKGMGLEPAQLEVEMLYGIRQDQQRRLSDAGYRVCALIAYGEAWYPWYMRRLAERPANIVFALRQMLP